MKISTEFSVIPDAYTKAAPDSGLLKGMPVVSFPFSLTELAPGAQYLHWAFTDPDSIPVCGFEWIHWTLANLPVDALMYDFGNSRALAIPEDFSRSVPAMIPEAVQGRTSAASKLVNNTDPAIAMRYNGPQPPDRDHEYHLNVWATQDPLPGLQQGFWLNALFHGLRGYGKPIDHDDVYLTGKQ